MTARLNFILIAAFWVTMNVLLWRMEFGSHGSDTPVPMSLVWRKILTAPDASSLSVFQSGQRTGYCEFSTSVGQEMAALDADKPPPEGLLARAGFQIHVAGNFALGDFTNRVKFDGRASFLSTHQWREFNLKISSRVAVVEIHSLATNQTVHVKILNDGELMERDLKFDELQDPGALIRAFAGDFAGGMLAGLELPILPAAVADAPIWNVRRTRVTIGTEPVPVYELETRVLDQAIVIDVSTLGEILSVNLPGNLSARIDEWSRP